MHLTEQNSLTWDIISLVFSLRFCSLKFCFFDSLNSCNIVQEVCAHLKKKQKDIKVRNWIQI